MTVPVDTLRRPRIKPEHRPYRTIDGNVRIGSVIHGIGAEIEDPQGWVWTLVETMDGTREPSAVVGEVLRAHPELPDLTPEDARQAMADLLDAGFVEDAAAPVPVSERERLRYSRGVPLLRWMDLGPRTSPWDAQLRLRRARVLLVGVGGTGGYAAQSLVASGVGRLHCVDPDVVELSNLNRQPLFRESDLGRPKVTAALATLRALNSDVTVTGERREIRHPADLAELIRTGAPEAPSEPKRAVTPDVPSERKQAGPPQAPSEPKHAGAPEVPCPSRDSYDLLVLAADRPDDIRRWANRVCLAADLPWVDAGYRGPLVTAGVHVPGRGACWECLRAGEVGRRELRLAPGQDDEVASPHLPWNPATAVTAGLSGGLLAHAALALLTGVPALDPGFRFGMNLMLPGDPVLQRFPRRPDCPACGDGPADGATGAGWATGAAGEHA
ncbi:Molybdopterin or thiamine biosynthesis adenylyltransferase [Streptomyces mirabilis]|uniref:Molybdopterin or thiamine biosynthesis adenylyltransferase n=1 Tax=Streptomyces mirabilis TaxID=68239 RepID=A0A1I2RLM8_9ACTN|nr:Molybdopterin or thiamine biosynthesis adenylyltransferase [Streptomyces mirabilis]